MKRLLVPITIILLIAACKKNNDNNNAAALLGSWRYTGNNTLVGQDLGDTLRFAKPDTVYYTYLGSTTWSNYQVRDSKLLLIGSAGTVTLTIRSLDATKLQLIITDPNLADTAAFQKFTP
jgi:hypothetical protein